MHEIELIKILGFGLLIALLLGYFTQKMKLSPIIGYLIAGFIIGPHFPGYTADIGIAIQLAEVGVILLMFGVGLHFNLKELLSVKNIAIVGALIQSFVAIIFGTYAALLFGIPLAGGIVIGIGLAVASTVVLMKMLEDNNIIDTKQGHIVVGWLIAEDILTVLALVLLPVLVESEIGLIQFSKTMLIAFSKVALYVLLTLIIGKKVIPWILTKVAQTKSKELFTLTILAIAFTIAIVAAMYFGVSFALGAFLAGMVVGNTSLHTEATADILPMRDAFSVIFFLSVGMLVDPLAISNNFSLLLVCFAIVLIVKPITAFLIVISLGYSVRIALTVAVGLAQIGEFSFILAQESKHLGLINQDIYSVIIGCSILSIFLNPFLFKSIHFFESFLMNNKAISTIITRRTQKKNQEIIDQSELLRKENNSPAIVIGFGPVGQMIYDELHNHQIPTTIIDLNINTISDLTKKNIPAIFGDATRPNILFEAGIKNADMVFITLPDINNIINVASEITKLNNSIRIYSRVRYNGSIQILNSLGIKDVFVEEESVSKVMIDKLKEDLISYNTSK